jgi:hypothetical protein
MALPQEIHVDDVGSVFKVTIYDGATVVDLSGATSIVLTFKKPNKALVRKTATNFTDGKDGVVKYTTVAGDLDIAGNWKLQAEVLFTSGHWWSNIVEFPVYPNLK